MRTIARMSSIAFSLSIAALGLAACQGSTAPEESVGEARLRMGAMQPNTILIYDAAGNGAPYEVAQVQSAGYVAEVASRAQWLAKSPGDFATYEALVVGEMTCTHTDPGPLLEAELTAALWASEVTGNVIVVGTDPQSHTANGADLFSRDAIGFAASGAGTGAYVSLGCHYAVATPGTPVPVLSGFGSFSVQGDVGGHWDAHQVAMDPGMVLVSDAILSNWFPTSSRELFESFPATFSPHVIVEDGTGPLALSFPDGSSGIPYVLSRGATMSLCGNGEVDPGELCDDGNYVSGDGCSEDCFVDPIVCGDGNVDQGEQCDDGGTVDGDGCSSTCQWEIGPSIGACCVSGGGCLEALSPAGCVAVDGVYTADTLTCAQVGLECLGLLGACCLPDVGCVDAFSAATCQNKGGSYLWDGATCADQGALCPPIEPLGACCVGGGCAQMTQADCLAANGSYAGAGSICDETTCPGCTTNDPIGACCVEGQCLMLAADACFLNGGLYAGDGSLCTSGTCDCGGPNGCCEEIAAGCSMTAGDEKRGGALFVMMATAISAAFGTRRRRRG